MELSGGSLIQEMTFRLRAKAGEENNPLRIWVKIFPGKGNSKVHKE